MKKFFTLTIFFSLFFFLYSLFFTTTVSAQTPPDNSTYYCHAPPDKNKFERCVIAENGKDTQCEKGWTKNTEPCKCGPYSANPDDECVQLENPLESNTTDIPTLIGQLIKGVLGIIGAITLLMFFWGARSWVMAAGNAEKVSSGTQTMVWAALGTLIVFTSYILVNFIINFLVNG